MWDKLIAVLQHREGFKLVTSENELAVAKDDQKVVFAVRLKNFEDAEHYIRIFSVAFGGLRLRAALGDFAEFKPQLQAAYDWAAGQLQGLVDEAARRKAWMAQVNQALPGASVAWDEEAACDTLEIGGPGAGEAACIKLEWYGNPPRGCDVCIETSVDGPAELSEARLRAIGDVLEAIRRLELVSKPRTLGDEAVDG